MKIKSFTSLLFALFLNMQLQAQRSVLLIIADDLGSDYCGFYEDHGDTVKLPNVRRLLSRGLIFRNAWSNPLCSPTRAGILTGRHSFRTGVGDVVVSGVPELDTNETTIPRLLRAGFPAMRCANIGKWHLSQPGPASFRIPNKMGYHHYEGSISGALPSYYTWNKVKNGQMTQVNRYATTENTDNAIAWLKAQGNAPAFLWLAFNAPHTPYHLPPASLHSFDTLSGSAASIAANPVLYFKAMSEAMDHEIGRLFDSLQLFNRWDSTDVVFIGDNGDDVAVAQNAGTGGNSKGGVYQNGVSVPFIISGPSVMQGGRQSQALVSTHDLFATILEMAGLSAWQNLMPDTLEYDSRSLMPILRNETDSIRPWAFTEVFRYSPLPGDGKAMRDKEFKLLDFDNGSQKFFHITSDPNENQDLLMQPLSQEAQLHYEYLCNQMYNLTDMNRFCDLPTAIPQKTAGFSPLYPNPFRERLPLPGRGPGDLFRLLDARGKELFWGENPDPKLAAELPEGLYLLEKISGQNRMVFRLLKTTAADELR